MPIELGYWKIRGLVEPCVLVAEHLGLDYKKVDGKRCSSARYGNYRTLKEAKKACTYDEGCSSVFDALCDNVGRFSLCPKASVLYGKRSCIHRKITRSSSKYLLLDPREACNTPIATIILNFKQQTVLKLNKINT